MRVIWSIGSRSAPQRGRPLQHKLTRISNATGAVEVAEIDDMSRSMAGEKDVLATGTEAFAEGRRPTHP